MTSPVATIGLTFDAVDLQTSDLQVFLEIVRGINESPNVRGSDVIVPAFAGRIEGNRKNDVLPIELVGIIQPDPAALTLADQIASFRQNVMTVRTLFANDRGRAELVATLEDGTQQSIIARPLNSIWSEGIKSHVATVNVELEGYDDWEPLGS